MIVEFSETQFVTVNLVKDWVNDIRDLLGMKQKTYAEVTNEECMKILMELRNKGEILWFRQVIDRTFGRSIQITIYGQLKVKENKIKGE